MAVNYIYPEFEIVRDADKCIGCRSCRVNCFYDAITMIQRDRKEDA